MNQKSSLITGLWEKEFEDGNKYFIGRIGHNLNAVIIPNKKKREAKESKDPGYFLYFVNGTREDIVKMVKESYTSLEESNKED